MPDFGLKYPNLTNSEIIEREFQRTIVLRDLPPTDEERVPFLLATSDYVLTPTELNHFSITGIQNVEQQIISACEEFHEDDEETVFLGFFVNKHDPNNPILHNILQQLKDISGNTVFNTIINHSYAIMNSVNFGLMASEYCNNSNTLKYGDLAEEILSKIAAHELKYQNIHTHSQKANMQDKNAESAPRVLPTRFNILSEQYPSYALNPNTVGIKTELADFEPDEDIELSPQEMNLLQKLIETFGNDFDSLKLSLANIQDMCEEDIPQIQKIWETFHTALPSLGLPLKQLLNLSEEEIEKLKSKGTTEDNYA
jgi:hypothetical protein